MANNTRETDASSAAVAVTADQLDAAVQNLRATGDLDLGDFRVIETDEGFRFDEDGQRGDPLSETTLRDRLSARSLSVVDWYFWDRVVQASSHRRAFLRWLESAEDRSLDERYAALETGLTREWGQLAISVSLTESGGRAYEIRHADEVGANGEALEGYDDPLDARELVKADDNGRYRPLKAAPTLPHGWRFHDLTPDQAYETVETIYPATTANWYRERNGELDVTHWRETVNRQSGIYGVVKTWDRGEGYDHVNWVAEACCDDSQCLKRREWEYDDDTELDVDGGDGPFPCREPCSVVISAARQWTKLEAEQSQTYEFELTPSEKTQVETIIDAVADGRIDEIREADIYDDANQLRTRFLRAKRFDEDGALGGETASGEE